MKIETFELERIQSLYENTVKYNLTESGIHPYNLKELLGEEEFENILSLRLGYGQTNGSIPLREAISRLYPGTKIENILVTNGSAEANYIITRSSLKKQDELIIMVPNYMQIWGIAKSMGVTVKPFHLREELKWGPDLDELKKQISPKTKMIAVCNPNNPTGAILSREEISEIVNIARTRGIWIYADEIYRGAELDGQETPRFHGIYDKVIINGGLSKAYGLPGLRIGWIAGPENKIEEAWAYHDYTSIATGILSNQIATYILQPETRIKILNRSRKILNANLTALMKWVTKHKKLFNLIPPKAGGMAFLKYHMNINSTELATILREEQSVFIIPGDCFGMDSYIRIGIGCELKYLLSGLKLIDEGLAKIQKQNPSIFNF